MTYTGRFNLNNEDIQKFLNEYKSYAEIASIFKCSKNNIISFCKKNNLIQPKKPSLIGTKFNNFEIIEKVNSKYNRYWKCKCICGRIRSLKECEFKTKISCGCKEKIYTASSEKKKNSKKWTGYKDISGKHLTSIKKLAYRRNIEYNITPEYMWEIFEKQNKKCAYTGTDLYFDMKNIKRNASLDRIDNTKGYVVGNIQWVLKRVNTIKMDASDKEFKETCIKVYQYTNSNSDIEYLI